MSDDLTDAYARRQPVPVYQGIVVRANRADAEAAVQWRKDLEAEFRRRLPHLFPKPD